MVQFFYKEIFGIQMKVINENLLSKKLPEKTGFFIECKMVFGTLTNVPSCLFQSCDNKSFPYQQITRMDVIHS